MAAKGNSGYAPAAEGPRLPAMQEPTLTNAEKRIGSKVGLAPQSSNILLCRTNWPTVMAEDRLFG